MHFASSGEDLIAIILMKWFSNPYEKWHAGHKWVATAKAGVRDLEAHDDVDIRLVFQEQTAELEIVRYGSEMETRPAFAGSNVSCVVMLRLGYQLHNCCYTRENKSAGSRRHRQVAPSAH